MIPFGKNTRFTGRKGEVDRLWRLLSTPHGPGRLAVTGLGGIGKTQLALELAYHMREHDIESSIFCIPCTSPEAIEQACTTIAQQLGILLSERDVN